jgi:glycosyltransferase involved in cell wall biosynthesis
VSVRAGIASLAVPLVSIIIPCHNAAPWLAETLESALAQTWQEKEIILVDDGSTDESLATARAFEPRGVRVLSQSNLGASAARNLGLQNACGDYLQFLDADDVLAPDKIERQLSRLTVSSAPAVATCAWARFYTEPTEARFVREPLWEDLAPVDWLVCSWEQQVMMATAAWLVPRAVAERAGSWNVELAHNPIDDMEYFSRVLLAAEKVLFCGDARVYYRSGLPDSLSQRRTDAAWLAIFQSFHLTIDRLLAHEDLPRTRHAGAVVLQRLVYECYPRMPALRVTAAERVRALGGCDLLPDAGPWRRRLQRLIGWKATKRLHDWYYHA